MFRPGSTGLGDRKRLVWGRDGPAPAGRRAYLVQSSVSDTEVVPLMVN